MTAPTAFPTRDTMPSSPRRACTRAAGDPRRPAGAPAKRDGVRRITASVRTHTCAAARVSSCAAAADSTCTDAQPRTCFATQVRTCAAALLRTDSAAQVSSCAAAQLVWIGDRR
jgi:hypothetical protein